MSLLDGIQSLDDLELENQVVFLRADLDVPIAKGGALQSDVNLKQAARTIAKLQALGARVIVGSRFGEKKSPVQKKTEAPSIEPAAARLGEILECDVLLPDACVGDSVKRVLMELNSKRVCVLENLASDDDLGPGSEAFARKLAGYINVYVGDSVRILSDVSATTTLLPRLIEFRAGGPSLMKEVSAIERINSGIDTPRVIVWGGNSLSARVDVLTRLAETAEHVVLVGVAANTVLRAQGGAMGRSSLEEDYLAGARTLVEKLGKKLVLPTDLLCAQNIKSEQATVVPASRVPEDLCALDLGPETQATVRRLLEKARTALWCGTAGFHKSAVFQGGTRAICEGLRDSHGFTMVAGDDSVAATHAVAADTVDKIDCVAQGGLAALSLLNDTKLAGLEALRGTTA